jgi:GntR family histidine utilization transcriptional repressor
MPTKKSSTPRYLQIKTFIQSRIASGDWAAGSPVPSESALMVQFDVARMTVNRALRELADQGMVSRIKGSGTVVAQLHKISSRLQLRDIHDEIVERGHTHTCEVLSVKSIKASPTIAALVGVAKNDLIYHSVLVHSENGVPIQYEDRYVNPSLVPDYLTVDFTTITPTHYLLDHAPITAAWYSLSACTPTQKEADALEMDATSPCLCVLRRTVSGGQWASVGRLLYPASRYSFEGQFQA